MMSYCNVKMHKLKNKFLVFKIITDMTSNIEIKIFRWKFSPFLAMKLEQIKSWIYILNPTTKILPDISVDDFVSLRGLT